MSFHLWKGAKNLLKSKAGGTKVGNMLRGIANKASGGRFGRGAMMKQAGESNEDRNNRLLDALGNGVGAANENLNTSAPESEKGITPSNPDSPLARLTGGIKSGSAKALLFPVVAVVGVIGAIIVVVKMVKKKKGK